MARSTVYRMVAERGIPVGAKNDVAIGPGLTALPRMPRIADDERCERLRLQQRATHIDGELGVEFGSGNASSGWKRPNPALKNTPSSVVESARTAAAAAQSIQGRCRATPLCGRDARWR